MSHTCQSVFQAHNVLSPQPISAGGIPHGSALPTPEGRPLTGMSHGDPHPHSPPTAVCTCAGGAPSFHGCTPFPRYLGSRLGLGEQTVMTQLPTPPFGSWGTQVSFSLGRFTSCEIIPLILGQ